jgi:gliding motility-associated-like protein
LFILFVLVNSTAFSQLDTEHFIAPMYASNHSYTTPGDQVIYLSTPSPTAVSYSIKSGDGTVLQSGNVSNSAPVYYTMNGYGTAFCVDENDLSKALVGRGVHVTASDKIYCNLRANSSNENQATSLTCKGKVALGNVFRIGHYPSPQNLASTSTTHLENKSATFGIYATEDNTAISIDLTTTQPVLHGSDAPSTASVITVSLNKGETYVLALENRDSQQNDGTGMVGALVTSDKPVAINCGSWGGNLAEANVVDVGIDQIVPYEKVGNEYAVVRGASSSDDYEKVMVVAHEDGTEIFTNGNATAIAIINAGEHYLISGSHYVDDAMYVTSNKPVFAFQFLMGSASTKYNTQGMNYLPPISCGTSYFVDNIPFIEKIGDHTYGGAVSIVTTKGAVVTVNGLVPPTAAVPVPGSDYEMYKMVGLTGDVSVTSNTIALVSFIGESGVAGYGGYYSGFEETIINEGTQCLPGYLFEGTGRFTTYQWFKDGIPLESETNDSIYATETGIYTFEYTLASCKDTSKVIVAVALNDFSLQGNTMFCAGDSVEQAIVGTGFDSVSWSTGELDTAIYISQTGQYDVRIYSDLTNECYVDTFVTVIENARPVVSVNDAVICTGNSGTFTATSDSLVSGYLWSEKGSGTSESTIGSTVGNYTVQITDVNGCLDTATGVLTINAIPVVNVNSATICMGDPSVNFTASSDSTAAHYLWSGNGSGNQAMTSGSTAGDYIVTLVDNNGCTGVGTGVLTVNALPVVTVLNKAICAGGATATFTATSDSTVSSYLWSENGTGTADTTTGAVVGNYTATIIDQNGCVGVGTGTLITAALPVIKVDSLSICPSGSAVEFTVSSDSTAVNYLWSANGTGTSPTTFGTIPGDYNVLVTDLNGCQGTGYGLLKSEASPTVSVANQSICIGGPEATFFADSKEATSYQWSDKGTGTDSITLGNAPGNYTVTVTDLNGCTASDSGLLIVDSLPQVFVNSETVCDGDSASTFTAISATAVTYFWSGNGSGTTASTSGTTAGPYIVTIVDNNGCIQTNFGMLTMISYPSDFQIEGDSVGCKGQELLINGAQSDAESFLWNTGSTASEITVITSGNYDLTASNEENGVSCAITTSIELSFKSYPEVPFLGPYANCFSYQAELVLDVPLVANFEWINEDSEDSMLIVTAAGVYEVDVFYDSKCRVRDSITVSEICPSSYFIPNAFSPNKDGVNDFFMPQINNIMEYQIEIFDRWGEEIFYSSDINVGWDGNYKGHAAQMEVYVYQITVKGHDAELRVGNKSIVGVVSLVR